MTEVEVSPLHGEGRTFGRLAGLRGELMAEFFGMFVLIALGDGVVAMAVAALPGSGRTASSATPAASPLLFLLYRPVKMRLSDVGPRLGPVPQCVTSLPARPSSRRG